MDSIPGYIDIHHGEVASVCKIILDREVCQPIDHGFAGDGIHGRVVMPEKLCYRHDISLLIGNIFGSGVLDTAQVTQGGEVLRGTWASRSRNNSLTTVNFKVGETALKVEFETRAMFSDEWDLPSADRMGRRTIIITARKEIITMMTDHHEFRDICDCLVSQPAAKYKPKVYEVAIDLGRMVFQPLTGALIGEINAHGDVITFMRGIFGKKLSDAFEMETGVPRRGKDETIGNFAEYCGVKVGELREPKELQSPRISACNYVRDWTFKVEGCRISARFETPKATDPDTLSAEEAAARQIITIRGPKHLIGSVPGCGELEAVCRDLNGRDIEAIKRRLVMAAPLPSRAPREGPRFPRSPADDIRRRDNERPYGAPHVSGLMTSRWTSSPAPRQSDRRDPFMKQHTPANPHKPSNLVEGVKSLTMATPRPGHDRLGRRTR